MEDKGKDKIPLGEESASSTHRYHRQSISTQATVPARPEIQPQDEEQEHEDLFMARLLSMVGSFEQLVKNPRMQKFLKSQQGDSQVESSHHATDRSIGQTPNVDEHVGRTPIVTTSPILPHVQAQDPAMNG